MSTIVVVEDDPGILGVVTDVLRDEGHHVVACPGGDRDGIHVVEQTRPEVVILDYQLPGMDGIEIARELHRRDDFKDLKIVAMTAAGRLSSVCYQMDADACLAKPFELDELIAAVERFEHHAGHEQRIQPPDLQNL